LAGGLNDLGGGTCVQPQFIGNFNGFGDQTQFLIKVPGKKVSPGAV